MDAPRSRSDEDLEAVLGLGAAAPGRRRAWILAAGVAAAAAGVAAFAWSRWSEGPNYETLAVERGDLLLTVSATGALEPVNQVDVGSELSGTVESVRVDYNDPVEVDQVLATLDTSQLEEKVNESRAALASAEASVLRAVATVRETRLEKERCEQLARAAQVCSRQEFERAEAAQIRAQAEEASARSQVALARAALEAEQARFEKAVVHSPIRGIVLARYVEEGQTLAANFQTPVLFTLAEDLRVMNLHLDVDEADIGRVREGQPATFSVDAFPERRFPAVITEVRYAPRTLEGVVTYETLLRVENPELLLRPGMTATADIEIGAVRDALLVPNSALRFAPPEVEAAERRGAWRRRRPGETSSSQRVWTLRSGEPVAIPIEIGATDGRRTEVRSGDLAPGAAVLVGVLEPEP